MAYNQVRGRCPVKTLHLKKMPWAKSMPTFMKWHWIYQTNKKGLKQFIQSLKHAVKFVAYCFLILSVWPSHFKMIRSTLPSRLPTDLLLTSIWTKDVYIQYERDFVIVFTFDMEIWIQLFSTKEIFSPFTSFQHKVIKHKLLCSQRHTFKWQQLRW